MDKGENVFFYNKKDSLSSKKRSFSFDSSIGNVNKNCLNTSCTTIGSDNSSGTDSDFNSNEDVINYFQEIDGLADEYFCDITSFTY